MSDAALSSSVPGALPASIVVLPWHDPVVEPIGFAAHSDYVELFWLPILGPTASWVLRRLAAGLDAYPDGYELDLEETAAALGLSLAQGLRSQFSKALQRCVLFGLMQNLHAGVAVRRIVPPLTIRQVNRLPTHLQHAHAERVLPSPPRPAGVTARVSAADGS